MNREESETIKIYYLATEIGFELNFHRECRKMAIKWPKLLSSHSNHLMPRLSPKKRVLEIDSCRKGFAPRRLDFNLKIAWAARSPLSLNIHQWMNLRRLKPFRGSAGCCVSFWVIFMHDSIRYFHCLPRPHGDKSDFQYCMRRKLIYLFSVDWLLRYISENVFLAFMCRSSLMVRKQWPEKLTESFSFRFLIE